MKILRSLIALLIAGQLTMTAFPAVGQEATLPTTTKVLKIPAPEAIPVPGTAQDRFPDVTLVPQTVDDLAAIEKRVRSLVKNLAAATVGIQIGDSQGSGVIVDKQGHILTAAHVAGVPGRKANIFLADGRKVSGVTLGMDYKNDAAIIKLAASDDWPIVEMTDANSTKIGQWCIATGHPDGYQADRTPVVRLGRVGIAVENIMQTDCTLVGGDSGGPLFDMNGQVIGIHSRIGTAIHWNFHVATHVYRQEWDRLVASDAWGQLTGEPGAYLGIRGRDHNEGCEITSITAGYPADRAGLKVGDIVTRIDGDKIQGFDTLAALVRIQQPNQTIFMDVIRGENRLQLQARLVQRTEND